MSSRASRIVIAALLLVAAGCKDEGTVTVHSLDFKGVQAVDVSKLKEALATRQSSKLPWGRKYRFDRSRFDADLNRIQAFYADRGYPDVRVSSFDVKVNEKQESVDLAIVIDEGQPVTISSVVFVGFDVLPTPRLNQLNSDTLLKPGRPRDRQLLLSTRETALNELRDAGYLYSRVSTTEEPGPTGKSVVITFTAELGPLAHFGPVTVQGNKSVADRIILREVTFKEGDLYRRSLVQDTERRLYGLELFQFANVEPVKQEGQPVDVPIGIAVAEGNHQRLNFGVGYGTEEKARANVEYHHLNFLGGARTAGIHGRWSSLDRGVRLDFNQPYFFAPRFSLGGEAQQWYTYTPAYQSIVTGAKATVTYRASPKTSWSVSFTNERDRSSIADSVLTDLTLRTSLIALGLDPRTGQQAGSLNAVGFDAQHSTTDNVLNAHRGYQVSMHTEAAGRLLPGTFRYTAVSVDARHYLPLIDRLVAASRVQFGNIAAADNDQTLVPFSKKYFLGGATSIRGWGRYEVSPLSSGLPIGGNSMLAFSEELRAAIDGNLGAVVFLDSGNVWSGSWGTKLNDLRYAVGSGLRYQTPIGSLRFDMGYQLNPIPDLLVNGEPQKRRWRLHFSIGQAF